MFGWNPNAPLTTAIMSWDTAVTVMASTAEEAMENIPEEFSHMNIVSVDYPSGWPSFPSFPMSSSPHGNAYIDPITGEPKLRIA